MGETTSERCLMSEARSLAVLRIDGRDLDRERPVSLAWLYCLLFAFYSEWRSFCPPRASHKKEPQSLGLSKVAFRWSMQRKSARRLKAFPSNWRLWLADLPRARQRRTPRETTSSKT